MMIIAIHKFYIRLYESRRLFCNHDGTQHMLIAAPLKNETNNLGVRDKTQET